MRLNLGCGTDIRDNYINIDIDDIKNDKIQHADIRNLNMLNIQDGSVEEILVVNVVEYIKFQEVPHIVRHWVDKLQSKGEIYIESLDANFLGLSLTNHHGTIDKINEIIFGDGKRPKLSLHSLLSVEHLLSQFGLHTVSKGYHNDHFYVRAIKS